MELPGSGQTGPVRVRVGVKPTGRVGPPQQGLLPGEEEPQLVGNAEVWLAVLVSRSLL